MKPLKPPTGQWAVVVRGKGAKGNQRNDVRLFTSKPAAVKFARYRQLEGRDAALFFSRTIPPWLLKPIPATSLEVSESAGILDPDGESSSPTSSVRQRPADELDEDDAPHLDR